MSATSDDTVTNRGVFRLSVRRPRAAFAALAVLVAGTLAALIVPTLIPNAAPAVTIAQQPASGEITPALAPLPFAAAWDRLDDKDRPFVVAVIGDSTGNEPGEWVDVAFNDVALAEGRPLIQHPWSIDTQEYLPELTSNEDAGNAPIIVWNGSASGKTGGYSLTHLETMLPERPDVIIFNHGLNNVLAPEKVAPQLTALVLAAEARWASSVGYAVILENPRLDKWQDAHAGVIENVRAWAARNPNILTIDAYGAYVAANDYGRLLLPDLLHPTPDGSALTATTVLDAIRS